eukprot:14852387-Alexandrium_andersonii.AAC.1
MEVLLGTIRRCAATPVGAACLVAVVELVLLAGNLAVPPAGPAGAGPPPAPPPCACPWRGG